MIAKINITIVVEKTKQSIIVKIMLSPIQPYPFFRLMYGMRWYTWPKESICVFHMDGILGDHYSMKVFLHMSFVFFKEKNKR